MNNRGTGLRKRSQINNANRTMFIWVAAMSAVVMMSLVISFHLLNIIAFNIRVLDARGKTVATLKENNENIPELKAQIRALDVNDDLKAVKANSEDQALQVVLDALPSTPNPLSFGASLQTILLVGPSGLIVKSISVDSVADSAIEVQEATTTEVSSSTGVEGAEEEVIERVQTDAQPIGFSFVVEGPEASLQEVLQRLERSIRTVYVDSISIERQGVNNQMTVQGHVFYQLERTAELKDEVIK